MNEIISGRSTDSASQPTEPRVRPVEGRFHTTTVRPIPAAGNPSAAKQVSGVAAEQVGGVAAKQEGGVADAQVGGTAALQIGSVLKDRYVLEGRLGGSGMVFKATDRFRRDEADRCVAIRIIQETAGNRPERLSNLRREFHRTQSLCHETIVKVYELDQSGDLAFFTMEYIEGKLLSDLIKLYSPRHIPRPDAWRVIGALCAGVAHVHSRDLVHGALRPQSIMTTRAGGVRILDFGLSRTCGGRRSRLEVSEAGECAQSMPAYSSWEVLDGQPADPRDDVYSLACICYELLTGAHPFLRRPMNRGRPPRGTPERPAGLTGRQWRTLRMGLSWERECRPSSVSEWFTGLNPKPAPAAGLLSPGMAVERTQAGNGLPPYIVVPIIVLLTAVSVLSSIHSRLPDTNAHLSDSSGDIPAAAHDNAGPIEAGGDGASAASAAPASAAVPASMASQPPSAGPGTPQSPAAGSAQVQRRADEGASKQPAAIFFAHRVYNVHPRQDFAEIRLRRSPGSAQDVSFNWWTEPASAKPGIDFVPQEAVTRVFAGGMHAASLFIKVLPNSSRKQPEVFYVDVAEVNGAHASPLVSRITVVLPKTG